jgi:glyoxylase-like metal-dependent hydrolase (beta-lactamase superfamily II)
VTVDRSDLRIHAATAGAFAENGYVVESASARQSWIVDPGACAPELVETVRRTGSALQSILLTHAHIDHVEGIHAVRAAFPDAPILLHDDDLALYRQAAEQAAWFGLQLDPLPEPDGRLEPGAPLAFGPHDVEIRHAPGHAPGHVIFVVREAGVALVGDVIFLGSIGRTDLPGGDFHRLLRSIREEVLSLPDEMRLLTGHGPETTVGHERRHNPWLVPQYRGGFA